MNHNTIIHRLICALALAVVPVAACSPAQADFTPRDLPGLQVWVSADAGLSQNNGAPIAKWSDQSGKGNDFVAADAKTQPTLLMDALNKKPAVRFDGIQDALELKKAIPAAGHSVFAVIRWIQARTYSFAIGNDAGTEGYLRLSRANLLMGGGKYPAIYQNQVMSCKPSLNLGTPATAFNIYAITDNPGSEKIKYLGRNENNNTASNRFSGDIAEVIIYDRALSDVERRRIEQYLGERYLNWPQPMNVPLLATAATPPAKTAPAAQGGIFANGMTDAPLPPGRYRLRFSLNARPLKAKDKLTARVDGQTFEMPFNESDGNYAVDFERGANSSNDPRWFA